MISHGKNTKFNLPFLRPRRIRNSLKNIHTEEETRKAAMLSILEIIGRDLRAKAHSCHRVSLPMKICVI